MIQVIQKAYRRQMKKQCTVVYLIYPNLLKLVNDLNDWVILNINKNDDLRELVHG